MKLKKIAKTGKKGYLNYNVNQYVYLLILSSNMNYYTLQYFSLILLLDKLFTMNLQQAERFKELYLNFIKLTTELVTFIKNHQFIQGFQISTSEFYKSDSKTIISIEEYISIVSQSPNERDNNNIETLELSPDEINDFEEFENQVKKNEAINDSSMSEEKKSSGFYNKYDKSSGVALEKQESNQKAKEEVARLVGSNISPLKKKTTKETSHKQKKFIKHPMLIIGTIKTEEKILEDTLKKKYKEEVLTISVTKSNDYGDLAELTVKKFESDLFTGTNVSNPYSNTKRKLSRKDSNTANERPSKVIKVDFSPDFDNKLFEVFGNGYSHLFSMKGMDDGGVKDDSMLSRLYNTKKLFF